MNITEIMDMMDDILDEAKAVPFKNNKSIVDCDKLRDCINDLRLSLPDEVKSAKNIVRDRKEIVDLAKKEADAIIKKAEERAKSIVASSEITKQAKQTAAEIINQANAESRNLQQAANKYIDKKLLEVEETLATNLTDIKKTHQSMKAMINSKK